MAKTTRFRDRSRKKSVGFTGLARAVLLLAVRDATAKHNTEARRNARRFLHQNNRMLGIYCELAEWDADYILENVERLSNGEAG